MPIVISRKTGEILSKPEYTQEQIDRAWEHIVKAWADKHPEELKAVAGQTRPETCSQ